MATIKDVADRAGVSTATVSRVLNQSGPVMPRTRARVLKAIEELNYVPDALARGTATQRSHTIGMIVPDIRNPFFAEMYLGASEAAARHNYIVWLVDSNENSTTEYEMFLKLRHFRVDGVLVTPVNTSVNIQEWISSPIPLCFVDREAQPERWDFVGIDNFQGAFNATRLLLQEGHTRIGIIAGPQTSTSGRERLEGFRAALNQANLRIPPEWTQIGDFHEKSGYELGLWLLSLKTPGPTALLSCNNLMTLGLLQAIRDTTNVHLSKTIAIIGFDDLPLATVVNPPLTVVVRPMRELGENAAELLIKRIERPERPVSRMILGANLIIRGSEKKRCEPENTPH